MKKTSLLIFLIFQSLFLFSQNLQIGGNFGVASYHGDVSSKKIWKPQELNVALNIFVRKNIIPQFTLRANLIFSKIKGKDSNNFDESSWRERRNFSFETPIQEFSILGEWQYWEHNNRTPFFRPYLFSGAGVLFSQPENIDTRVDFSIPIGWGFTLDLKDKMSIGFELSSRILFTDLIDGISDKEFSNGNDSFFNAGLSFMYSLE